MRYFNTAGPCLPDWHYMLPPEPRLPGARPLIDQGQYFVVHAPRQTGKTTTLIALAHTLTAEGRYAALYFSGEAAEPMGDDVGAAENVVLHGIHRDAKRSLPIELRPPDPWPEAPPGQRLGEALDLWAQTCPRPLVLFFDEVDALRGESLRSALRQLRNGFRSRPTNFPHSVVLCGLRDVRDYKAASGGDPNRLGTASPFNVKVASLRIGDFTEADVGELYGQHTAETGQAVTDAAIKTAFAYTQGQPWLVNALAREVVEQVQPPPEPITPEHIDEAKERLILARATHLDSLVARLHEPRVRRVVGPLIAGDIPPATDDTFDDDVAYLRDLGLLAPNRPIRIANPIYREVIVRVLGGRTEDSITADPRSFVLPDGRLDFDMLLREFTDFWRQHGEVLATRQHYHEVAAQLVFMAYLHRIVNGGGYIDREYGVGRGRIDLAIRWPYTTADGKRRLQQEAVELKVWRLKQPDPLPEGLHQLDSYLDRLGLDHGTLVVFDRRDRSVAPAARIEFADERTPSGRPVRLLRA